MKPLVYLAGKMGGRLGADVLAERGKAIRACKKAGVGYIDPAENENISPDAVVDLAMSFEQMRRFVSKDEYAIRQCDVILVLTADTPSEGTGIEIGLALALHMPVVLVSPKRVAGTLMGFWSCKADAMFNTVEEAVKYIADTYRRYD